MSLYTEYKKLTKEHKHSYILSLKEFNKVKYPQRLIKAIKENKAITYNYIIDQPINSWGKSYLLDFSDITEEDVYFTGHWSIWDFDKQKTIRKY